jgi:hypothetical protein
MPTQFLRVPFNTVTNKRHFMMGNYKNTHHYSGDNWMHYMPWDGEEMDFSVLMATELDRYPIIVLT